MQNRIQSRRPGAGDALACLALLLTALFSAEASRLESSRGTLILEAGSLRLEPRDPACPAVLGGGPFWEMTLQTPSGPVTLSAAEQQPSRVEITAEGWRLTYDKLSSGAVEWKIGLSLEVSCRNGAFEFQGALRNTAEGTTVRTLVCPALSGIAAPAETHPLLWPNGLGQKFGPAAKPGERSFPYPGRTGTMPWCCFAGESGGLYLGSHDPAYGAKEFASRLDGATRRSTLAIRHQPFCGPGRAWTPPPAVLFPYAGSWHAAAEFYRAWYGTAATVRRPPDWVRDASGWLLCILKQQNGSVMWDYPSLARLCEVADQRGLDLLGLFGWAHGGHDHLYPDYLPCPDMGGPEALRQALREVRARGKRSILYANGQLMDTATDYYRTRGKDQAARQEDGAPVMQNWQKFRSFPPVKCALACQWSEGWQQRMLELARQAQQLGADGILFDQLGVTGPMACWAGNHGHPAPAMAYAGERSAWLRRVADEMQRIDPHFIVMTEGVHDSLLDSVALLHGCEVGVFTPTAAEIQARLDGTAASGAAFPEMFRYTFPEVLTTQRHPTPMLDRLAAHYACLYGLRFEIESRYAPDVRYLRENIVPAREEYADILNPPHVAMMAATPPQEAARYLKQLVAFQRRHADLLWRGRFVDDRGMRFEGKGLLAKAYTAGDQTGVLVWNPGNAAAAFTLEVPGSVLQSAQEPEREAVEPFSALPPQSIRLLRWRKATP